MLLNYLCYMQNIFLVYLEFLIIIIAKRFKIKTTSCLETKHYGNTKEIN